MNTVQANPAQERQGASPSTWRVLWNAKLWNFETYLEYINTGKTVPFELDGQTVPAGGLPYSLLPQAKGNVLMKEVPKRGDKVKFVVSGLGAGKDWIVVAEGTVFSGFQTGEDHKIYPLTQTHLAPSHMGDEFLYVLVTPLAKDKRTVWQKDGQRTWLKK